MRAGSGVWSFADGERWDFGGRSRILGILNVTPDSFSDGGLWLDPARAVARGLEMVEEGADGIDIGGESTRPGSLPVPEDEQMRRILPVIRGLRARLSRGHVRLSVDTTSAAVADAALQAGADIVNDTSGLRSDPGMARLIASRCAALVVMHMRGTPSTMQDEARYGDLLGEIREELRAACALARAAGIPSDRIVVDPGIGFAKTTEHNLEVLSRLDVLAALGRPLLVGVSRKSFLGKVTGLAPGDRLEASLGAGALALAGGASVLRVHDVGPSVRMSRTVDAILRARHQAS